VTISTLLISATGTMLVSIVPAGSVRATRRPSISTRVRCAAQRSRRSALEAADRLARLADILVDAQLRHVLEQVRDRADRLGLELGLAERRHRRRRGEAADAGAGDGDRLPLHGVGIDCRGLLRLGFVLARADGRLLFFRLGLRCIHDVAAGIHLSRPQAGSCKQPAQRFVSGKGAGQWPGAHADHPRRVKQYGLPTLPAKRFQRARHVLRGNLIGSPFGSLRRGRSRAQRQCDDRRAESAVAKSRFLILSPIFFSGALRSLLSKTHRFDDSERRMLFIYAPYRGSAPRRQPSRTVPPCSAVASTG
jgi:hypothetical protein